MIFKKIKNNPKACTYIKWLLGAVFLFFAIVYTAFLFVLPNVIDINRFTPLINKTVEEMSGFKFELVNPEFKTTWKLGIKLSSDKMSLKYKNGEDFINLISPSLEINLVPLIFGRVNLDKIYASEANLALTFTKDKKYTLENYISNIINSTKNTKTQQNATPAAIKLGNINIDIPLIKFALKDENISEKYILEANNSKISFAGLSGPLKIKTGGYLKKSGSAENFTDFNINLQTKLPEFKESQDKNASAFENFKLNFNPIAGLDKFSLRSKLDVDLKITDPGENFSAKGYANIEKISLKAGGIQLPEGYINTKFERNTVKTQSRIYISENEYILANNSITTGKKPKINLNIKTEYLNVSNIKTLAMSVFNMFGIKNGLNQITALGALKCDFNLISDFKTVKSSGLLELKEGVIKYPKAAVVLDTIASTLDFGGNKITIKDTGASLNGSKFKVSGTIDTKTNLDIKIKSDPLKISDILKLAQGLSLIKPEDIKDFDIKNGTVVASVDIKGDLKNIIPQADIELNSISLLIKSLNMPVSLDKIVLNAKPDKKDKKNFAAQLEAHNFKASSKNPNLNISAQQCLISADSKNISLTPFNLLFNGSIAKISGDIKNYTEKPDINIRADGKITPGTILAFVPAQNKKYISYAGQIPFDVSLSGGIENLKILANLTSDSKNYVSIAEIKNIAGKQNRLHADINLKQDLLVINSAALTSNGTNMASVNGKINNIYSKTPQFSPLNILTGQKLSIYAPALGRISFDADANIALSGGILNPQITGSANVSNLNWQEFKTAMSNAYLEFKKSIISVRADGIKAAGSDFSGNAEISSNFSKNITVNSLNFTSSYIDTDALLKLISSMPNTQTTAGPSVPLGVKNGTGKIAKLKSGNIIAHNIAFDFNMHNNLVKLSNITAVFADGKITADADYNIATTKVNIDGTGKAINARKAASCFAGGSSILLGGTMNGIAKLSLRGNTYDQQMRTLNGQVIFDISNGQYGEAARFERFLHAGNLLTQSLFNLNLNQAISAVTSKNTGEFKKIEGKISLSNGWANITSLESSGPNMSLYITGKYNLLTGNSDLKILGRISSVVVNVLGPLGTFSLDKVVNKLPQTGVAILNTIKAIAPQNPLFADINSKDIANIPPLSVVSNNTESKDFQVLINGPIAKTTSIKSFKWANKETPPAAGTN